MLVTGASIAGPAAAYWLERIGYEVTVLERSPEPRLGGQNIDVRGLAKQVLERMGLRDAVLAANTGEVGTRFVDAEGATVSEFPAEAGEGDGPTAELEVLRGELARILTEACGDGVTWWSGDHVVALDQTDDAVTVTLAGGDEHAFDLLVVAEGPGSRTRGLVLGEEQPELKRLGMYMAWATIPRTDADDDWWRWMTVPGSRSVTLRPDNLGTTRATLGFMSDPVGFEEGTREEQVAELRRRFGDLGWEVPRVLDALEAGSELYVEDLTQVIAPTWSRGRVVLLGDAAWCVTPIAGAGTSLALVGAYVLAVELSRLSPGRPPTDAFARWEDWMRPMVEDAQDLPPGTPRLANPETRLGTALLRVGTKVAASRPVRSLAGRLTSGPDDERGLPDLPA
ncbi:FAD-binding monooxygenase [Marmoricola sp. Leaf446]|nr:FAD-binding monooxygenase [Marmoricola sp. Leaf446]